jgi:hypothetical protein
LRPFIAVGLAYFLIAVVVPLILLRMKGEKGHWTTSGTIWSLMAGAAGALGALGIIMAFKFRGSPVYVMPVVFGCAPVVNTFVTMWMTKTYREAGPIFFAGVALVALGAAGVLYFQPRADVTIEQREGGPITVILTEPIVGGATTTRWTAADLNELQTKDELGKAYKLYLRQQPLTLTQKVMIPISVILAALSWGCYGPTLHKGQMKMDGSRLRPFLCVGLAYFAIAVVIPWVVLTMWAEPGYWSTSGTIWSVGAGAAGAVGALGIIMAFNFGGKPIYVMPLVFGGAPVVNTFTTIVSEGTFGAVRVQFYISLLLAVAGAVTVLVFAPRPARKESHATGPTSFEPDHIDQELGSAASSVSGDGETSDEQQRAGEPLN